MKRAATIYADHWMMGGVTVLIGVQYVACLALAATVRGGTINDHRTSISEAPGDSRTADKSWTRFAMQKMWAERRRMGETNVHIFEPPGFNSIRIVFKNESASPTGSLKHRYAWALMTWALLEQKVKNGTHVFEASSGNTACSLGYMCKMLGLPFTAIVPDTLETAKQRRIENVGAKIIKVPISKRLVAARQHAEDARGFFMNQFKNAFYAEEFHESGNYEHQSANLMHEIVGQIDAPPDFFIHPAGTGGTLSSIGRYVKKYSLPTEIILADTQFSVYYDYVLSGKFTNESGAGQWVAPGMAGIGYGPMGAARIADTTSLDPAVIDRVLKIPDLASTAAMKVAYDNGIRGGTSTGVNFLAALHIAATDGRPNTTIATILADSAIYYTESYLNRDWISHNFAKHGGLPIYDCWIQVIENSIESGFDPLEIGNRKCV